MNKDLAQTIYAYQETKRKLLSKFSAFRKYYFSHYNKLEDSIFHEDISALLDDSKRGNRLAIAAPRGSAKSTLITLQYVIFCICLNLEKFIIIISNTSDQASNFLANVKSELEANEKLCKDFPTVCEIRKKPTPARWTQKEIVTRNGIQIIALGAGQQIRGRRNKQHRPTLIILDDIEKDDSVQNPESYYKLNDWLEKSVLKAGTSETNVIFVGTIHHYESLLAKYISPELHYGWKKKIYRSVISWADNIGLWEKWRNIYTHREEYQDVSGIEAAKNFFNNNKEAMLLGVKVLWPEAKSYYDLMVQREDEGYISFDSEMQNEPVNPRDCIFNMNDVHYWDDRFPTDTELLQYLKANHCDCQMFGACDPSLGKQNKSGDYSAIITVAYDSRNKICYVLDADLEKRPPDKTIDAILALHKRREFIQFGFESNGFQSYLVTEIEKRARLERPIAMKEINNTSDKRSRIESLQPMIKNGTIQFCKRQLILLEQLKLYPKSRHDDGLDALQMVFSICYCSWNSNWASLCY